MRTIRILGTRGVPAAHGGFETFAEHLALYLVAKDWKVTVYCQVDGDGPVVEDAWQGVDRVHIPVAVPGPRGTVIFDWKAAVHAAGSKHLCLTLGYNTAVFGALLRLRGIPNLFNMDGIEWSRAKWGAVAKAWFYLNERAGCWLGDHLIADHPEIAKHLATRARRSKITMIPYGADVIDGAAADPVVALGLLPGRYVSVIGRPEPENSVLEIVRAFSQKPRGFLLAVLGRYEVERNAYHQAVMSAASGEVRFLGPIYDKSILRSLRYHSAAYVHGHQVGGTNPSLIEAMGAGNAVLAHDNRFNRWVAGSGARYFKDEGQCAAHLEEILSSPVCLDAMRAASRRRLDEVFTWDRILREYESLLERWAQFTPVGANHK